MAVGGGVCGVVVFMVVLLLIFYSIVIGRGRVKQGSNIGITKIAPKNVIPMFYLCSTIVEGYGQNNR